jgi:acyl-ACP thioesterase
MTELTARPDLGRRYTDHRRVRLSDAGSDGVLRLDGVGRYLQDAASDDWADSGLDPAKAWVVRRTSLRVAEGGRWPALGEELGVTTWCSGTGPAWAERRTDLELGGVTVIEAVALWVPLDASGRPSRLGEEFHDVYGQAAAGRRVSGRVTAAPTPRAPRTRAWLVRRSDLDVAGHVNNAAIWAAVAEVVGRPVASAALTHYGPIEEGDDVTLLTEPGQMWLLRDGKAAAFAEFVA